MPPSPTSAAVDILDAPPTVQGALSGLLLRPGDLLVRCWNWKSALFSSTIRAAIFFFANLTAGMGAASGAMLAEFVYRAATSGFYGSVTQAFRRVQPVWAAALSTMVLLPVLSHSLEFVIHYLRGTPNLKGSIVASVCFTVVSTLFNLYAMRRGALVVGSDGHTLASDMKRMPVLIAGFLAVGPVAILRLLRKGK